MNCRCNFYRGSLVMSIETNAIFKTILPALTFVLITAAASAAICQEYQIVSHTDGSAGITMRIPYDAGTHTGSAQSAGGTVKFDAKTQTLSGQLAVPLAAMTTGNDKRDCHMRE